MTVELFGAARQVAGRATVEIVVEEPSDEAALVRALARTVPGLAGTVVDVERGCLIEPNYLLLDGRRAPRPGERIAAADRPCILVLASGG